MPISDVQIRTITREGADGQEWVSFNPQIQTEVDALPDWAKAVITTESVRRTIACDGVDETGTPCIHVATFNPASQEDIVGLPDWIRTFRMVNLGNGAKFGYCSDVCEVNGVTTGKHNVPEPKQIQEATSLDAQRAIAEAKVAESMKTKPSKSKKVSLT
jgi:hypothetical protein